MRQHRELSMRVRPRALPAEDPMPQSRLAPFRRSCARTALIVLLAASSSGLAGCFTLAATGVALGALAVIDRRTIGAQTEDQAIELKSIDALSTLQDKSGIAVTSFNRRVLLTGQVLSEAEKQQAAAAIAGISNVRSVYNELAVAGKASLQVAASDTTITTRVKTSLLRDPLVPGNSVKVKTESSIVYLMGLVTYEEAQRAAEIASTTPGVARVVTVFEIISQAEAESLEQAPRDAPPPAGGARQ